ncbi:hypothetical protein MUP01_04665 [Candidatus Bathyarchaeota archaeon]|nr:hypothetical protein [Candidatus Bathyarchaeota archaeon]
MPKTEWRNWLQIDLKSRRRAETQEERQMRMQRERKMRFEIRRIAQRAMKDLVLIMNYLPNVSKHPERDYARIFADGELFLTMMDVCDRAYHRTFKASLKLRTKENLDILQDALINAGLGHLNKMKLSDPRIWEKATRQLERKEAEDDTPYYEMALRSRQAAHHAPTEASMELTMKTVARSKMLMDMWKQERALEKKEQMERTSGPAEESKKGV